MSNILVVIGLAILFVGLAFAGLAVKSFFKKDATLRTCSGGSCGCHSSADSCQTEVAR
ncbi:hypothetical protein [Marinilabilia salmonicolor]|jgi:hypothetical protein|uniref:Uncharacterized protein n=1 Tax=Marinilabilia salmonicolor TaxID=989 RepID=A0A2T0XNH8_9BACT|nr:hypothetical protein [Marinilabilia salmonicolor]PRZ00499.1 hypothetical protein BY457_10511 [Marinilabilia salmonicolor]RCW32709.1 hypothetical protein DFO77_11435 [Marinilabilia salmonicolor]